MRVVDTVIAIEFSSGMAPLELFDSQDAALVRLSAIVRGHLSKHYSTNGQKNLDVVTLAKFRSTTEPVSIRLLAAVDLYNLLDEPRSVSVRVLGVQGEERPTEADRDQATIAHFIGYLTGFGYSIENRLQDWDRLNRVDDAVGEIGDYLRLLQQKENRPSGEFREVVGVLAYQSGKTFGEVARVEYAEEEAEAVEPRYYPELVDGFWQIKDRVGGKFHPDIHHNPIRFAKASAAKGLCRTLNAQ